MIFIFGIFFLVKIIFTEEIYFQIDERKSSYILNLYIVYSK